MFNLSRERNQLIPVHGITAYHFSSCPQLLSARKVSFSGFGNVQESIEKKV